MQEDQPSPSEPNGNRQPESSEKSQSFLKVARAVQSKEFYEFGPYRLYPAARVLLRDGANVALTPKVLDTLKALVENAGQPVSKEELLRSVWPDTFVEESNLAQNISVLRKALGTVPGGGAYIETIAKRGYRFVSEVRLVPAVQASVASEAEPASEPAASTPLPRSSRKPAVFLAMAMLVCVAGGLLYFRQRAAGHPVIRSIAVIPLRNVSGDPGQDYLASGITELLTTEFGKLLPVRVTSRTSAMRFKDTKLPIGAIARQLKVDAVVEGSVARQGDRLRVTTELIQASSDRHLWAETYDRDVTNVLLLEEEIALVVAREIKSNAFSADRARPAQVNRNAFESYLRARYFLDQRSEPEIRKAIASYRHAIEEDPAYAAPYAGLADCYNQLGTVIVGAASPLEVRKLAAASARRALEIDPDLAEAHAALAYCNLYDWNWAAAEQGFLRAIHANPSYASAHLWFAHYLAARRHFDRALQEVKLARDLDPLSPVIQSQVGWILEFAGRREEAIQQFRAVLANDPNYQWALWRLGATQMEMHDYASAIRTLQKNVEITKRSPSALAALGHAFGLAGRRDEARKILDELIALSRQRYVAPQSFSGVYQGLGDRDKAFEWLEKCYQERANNLIWLDVSHMDDNPLRSDPRFDDLLRRIGLK
jgi:TolB-like protein/DNA-binding winged helix-turn-helix (wHTH) protein/Tfp pilus assembly protein PilF